MTERDIQNAIRRTIKPTFCLPGVTDLLLYGHADLIAISRSNYLTEYEIKTNIPDLRRDKRKLRWINNAEMYKDYEEYPGNLKHFENTIKFYYIVVPAGLEEKALLLLPHPNAGLIVCTGRRIKTIKPAKANRAKPMKTTDWKKMAFMAARKYWYERLET